MKIALLSHEGGGISSVTYGLATSLSKKKIKTTIFTTKPSAKKNVWNINDYLNVIQLPLFNFPPRSFWFHLRNSRLLSSLLSEYSIVHAVSPEMILPRTFNKNLDKPLITTIHGSPRAALKAFIDSPAKHWVLSDFVFHVAELPLHDMIIKNSFSRSNKVVVCSFSTQNDLITYEKIEATQASVIHNGVDFAEIEAVKVNDEDVEKSSEFSIMYAGRLFWMKGVKFALKAYEEVNKQTKNIKLKIFGEGPLKGEIKQFVARKGLDRSVYFGGFIPHKELIAEIKKSDLIVFPSLYESQPMLLLEAMACKKPSIAFNLPYAREIITNDDNGILTKVNDTKEFSDEIVSLLHDTKLRKRLGENAYNYAKKNHDWNLQVEKYLKLYEEISITA